MAGPKGSKYYDVFLKYHINLEKVDNENILGCEGFGLLDAIRTTGSLASAAAEMNISYRKAWGIIKEVEDKLGFSLVEKHRGGAEGGYTHLTVEGNELMDAYNELTNQFNASMKDITRRFFWSINTNPDEKQE
ncbi:MAG TPA: ModE family transcriptional regulator [Bacteroidales bacterium]|nr:ModE family transcriptional regulator [Bacteroidales bacterium]